MMRVSRACSVATCTAVVSVLGHKWSQLIGPRYPRLAASDPMLRPCTAADVIREQTRQIPVGAGRSPRPGPTRALSRVPTSLPPAGPKRAAEPMRTPSNRAPVSSRRIGRSMLRPQSVAGGWPVSLQDDDRCRAEGCGGASSAPTAEEGVEVAGQSVGVGGCAVDVGRGAGAEHGHAE
jgi:hypothetical protein